MEGDATDTTQSEDYTGVLIAGLLLAGVGWSGLLYLFINTLPTVGMRWAFFALFYVAVSGSALPFARYLNERFRKPDAPPVAPNVLVRQGSWVGLFGTACAWLRVPRVLSWPVALFLAFSLTAIEVLLRLRERSQVRPESDA